MSQTGNNPNVHSRQGGKQNMVHTHNGIPVSKKKKKKKEQLFIYTNRGTFQRWC